MKGLNIKKLIIILITLVPLINCQVYDCSQRQLARCKSAIEQQLLESNRYLSTLSQIDSCKQTRANFDCILWYSSHCLDYGLRSHVDPLATATRAFLIRHCEDEDKVEEGWQDSLCYRSDQVTRCSDRYHNGRYGPGQECTRFNELKRCVSDALAQNGCDRKFLMTYLMDRWRFLAWTCQADDFRGNTPLEAPLVKEMAEGLSCVTRIVGRMSQCNERYYRSVYDQQTRNGCCDFYRRMECAKNAAIELCAGHDYLYVMKAMEDSPTGAHCNLYKDDMDSCSSGFVNNPHIWLALITFALRVFA